MSLNSNICNNCGKQGHQFHQCKLPITSYGIIAFHFDPNYGIQYLMLRRKDSFGYIDFIRGKYSPNNVYQLQNIINEMSAYEKEIILKEPFSLLWNNMWGNSNGQYKNEEQISCKKFNIIKEGVFVNTAKINLSDLVNNSSTNWTETEWEFPKGRRNYKEKDLECSLREFEEETGIQSSKLSIIDNVLPFEEIFIGSNHKSYKHKYFLAYIKEKDINLNNFQVTEVSKLEWKTIDQCLESIRPYNLEKKQLIKNINKVLEEYRLYS
jgi:8-oxo-dGTP pyrophosphatase MutT (NUDIX family)